MAPTQKAANALESHLKGEWVSAPSETNTQTTSDGPMAELIRECTACTRCSLYKTAKNLVFSDGNENSKLVFIGEAPGADEDEQGKPFVGRAGKLLTATLEKFGQPRRKVYICNILKHRPPENRNPLPDEIEACTPFLVKQLSILQPKLIVTLGNFSTKFILKTEVGITRLRGRLHESPMGYPVMPTLHPAAVLRNINATLPDFESDIQEALKIVRES